MIALSIPDVKPFMSTLLQNTLFDTWELRGCELNILTRYTISGVINRDYLNDEEAKQRTEQTHLLWQDVRKKIFELIRGGRTPTSMKITLAFPKGQLTSFSSDSIESLLLNIHFDGGVLQLITGTSMKAFSLDKSAEHMWDEYIPSFCKQHSIAYSFE